MPALRTVADALMVSVSTGAAGVHDEPVTVRSGLAAIHNAPSATA